MTESFHIVSPVDGSVYAERPMATRDAALAAAQAAAEAQAGWRQTPLSERRHILGEAVDRLLIRGETVSEELARQMGRPVGQGRGELAGFEERARHMLDIAPRGLADLEPEPRPGFRRFIRHEPLGVVFTIAPWNYPYLTAVNSIWPALAAGNAVLLKHATQTALHLEVHPTKLNGSHHQRMQSFFAAALRVVENIVERYPKRCRLID